MSTPSIGARLDLPYLGERPRCATPKHEIVPSVITKDERRKKKVLKAGEFRAAVWKRDEGKSRASGKPLAKSGTDPHRLGEVHHVLKRSTHPEDIYNPENGILLSKFEHALAETACALAPEHCLLEIDGSEDRGKPQKFTWRDRTGTITKETRG